MSFSVLFYFKGNSGFSNSLPSVFQPWTNSHGSHFWHQCNDFALSTEWHTCIEVQRTPPKRLEFVWVFVLILGGNNYTQVRIQNDFINLYISYSMFHNNDKTNSQPGSYNHPKTELFQPFEGWHRRLTLKKKGWRWRLTSPVC